ncbi:IclR family transcriptional regulator [Pusillimonas noertemannii]|uniref:IclR family transcriptional regulator n=1 Tax=Pusillimonas noertemannii TaxID=305977 RepID=A0A2U1CPU1_9BURK|nr:IclR family transcriptional regulator [Pusillimonas noertemannii]NYT67234.1 IclR family transcriptional regulator [Pusillimonas noertemannii]PVY67907.1 IclR family transcriptional regulator [Pusillimonas noertemannii]
MISSAIARGRPKRKKGEPVGIQTVETAMEVLDIIAQEGSAIGLSELSRKTGLIPSKLHRYLVTLTRYGMVKQSVITGMYDLGATALRIGLSALNRHDAMSSAQEVVGAITATTHSTVALYIWTDIGPTLVRLELGSPPPPAVPRVGAALPLVHSGTGRVFLAHLPAARTAALLRKERTAAKADGLTFPSEASLAQVCADIRANEIYWTRDAVLPGTVGVMAVLRKPSDPLCVITAVLPPGKAGDKRKEQVAGQLVAARNMLQRECGLDMDAPAPGTNPP